MKPVNRTRIAIAASAALGLAAMSSSAVAGRAPFDRAKECPVIAYNICYVQGSPFYASPAQCWEQVYNACMEGEYYLAVNAAHPGDRRIALRPEFPSVAAVRPG